MVHTPDGIRRVGKTYYSLQTAREWLPFVRASFRGCKVEVRSMVVRFDDSGQMDDKSRKRLDEEFNMEVPEVRQ